MKYSIPVGLLSMAVAFGCSDEREPIPDGGTRPADAATEEASAGGSADVSIDVPATDGYIDLFDVFPLPDGGCPGCIRDRCGAQINACANNPACTAGLICTLQMCAAGLAGDAGITSPTNLVCLLGCFNGDQATAFMALGSLTCVTMTCGGACGLADAGVDAPSNPDARTPPDAETGADAPTGIDAAPETGGQLDTGSPTDVTPDVAPPDDSATD